MSKMSKAIAVLGVVAGLGVAALPLSSYAVGSDSEQAQVVATVSGSINLTLTGGNDFTHTEGQADKLDLGNIKVGGDVVSSSITAKVETNDELGYTLSMRALNDAKMLGDTGVDILSDADHLPKKDSAGWGYKVGAVPGEDESWEALPTADAVIVSNGETKTMTDPAPAEGATYTADDQTTIFFGVTADSSIPEGTYTGTVVFTAAVK